MCFFTTALQAMIVFPSIHTAINPWVYFAYSKNFRHGFKRLIHRMLNRRSSRVAAKTRVDNTEQNADTEIRIKNVNISNNYSQFESDYSSFTAATVNQVKSGVLRNELQSHFQHCNIRDVARVTNHRFSFKTITDVFSSPQQNTSLFLT